MTRHDTGDAWGSTEDLRWSSGHDLNRVIPGTVLEQDDTEALTWPSAVYPAAGAGYDRLSQHGQLTLNALLAPDLPRPMNAAWTQWPGWQHVWPGALSAAWSGLGFWANTEPLHPLFAAGFGLAGTVLVALGALGIAASNAVDRDAEAQPSDTSGTRALIGLGGAAWAGAAASGAGFSGIGCMLAFGSVGAAYLGASGWRHFRRDRAIRSVIDYANATNPGPLPSGGLPFPPVALPENRLPSNPYEHRLRQALEAMKINGTWFGSPMRVADDTWRLPFQLPPGANLSPEQLAKKEDVIKSNARARRIEIEPTHGANGVITVYDGPDRTADNFPWNGNLIKSVEKPFPAGFDEAARPTEIDFTEHILVTGRTRMGKSAFLRYLMCATLECNIVRLGIDCKDGAPGLGMLEPIFYKLATDPLDAWRMQFGIKAISAARGIRMRERGTDVWSLDDGPRVVSVIDELIELTLRTPEAAEVLKSNLILTAASKITLINAAQAPPVSVWGKDTTARKQHGKRIGFKNDAEANPMTFGGLREYRLQDLDAAGQFLISSLDHMRPRRNKAVFMDIDPAMQLVERYADRLPQLDAMSAEAFEKGMADFDDAIAAGQDPLEMFEPPPSGGGGGRRRTSRAQVVEDSGGGRPALRLVTNYPGTEEQIELRHLALWNLLGSYGADGATAMELAAKQLDGFTSESNVRTRLRAWADRKFIESVKDGRAERWWRIDLADEQVRKDA